MWLPRSGNICKQSCELTFLNFCFEVATRRSRRSSYQINLSLSMQIHFLNLGTTVGSALRISSARFLPGFGAKILLENRAPARFTSRSFSQAAAQAAQTDGTTRNSENSGNAVNVLANKRARKPKVPFPEIPPAPKRIVAAVVLERLPVITPDPEPWLPKHETH